MNNYSTIARRRLAALVASSALIVPILAGCGGGDSASTTATAALEGAATSALLTMDGRGVSASNEEIVLRTPGGEWTFKVRPEDVVAVDPDHFNSHIGVDTIGYRIFYVTENGVDYAVSVEEIDGTTLGFD